MKTLQMLTKKELFHELLSANTDILLAIKMAPGDKFLRKRSRLRLQEVIGDIERRKLLQQVNAA
jgi:hypothetical protein